MLKSIKNLYKATTAVSSIVAVTSSYASTSITDYINDEISVTKSINNEINLPLISKLLSRIEDVADMDIPTSAKELVTAKLQAMLTSELEPTE
jgi:hypothetical protein